jgi:flagellar basal body L-ring protein FlgH
VVFHDPRAMHVGDVITVTSVTDTAKMQNTTSRSRNNLKMPA